MEGVDFLGLLYEYIKADFIIVAVALYALGMFLKGAPGIKDWVIPFVLLGYRDSVYGTDSGDNPRARFHGESNTGRCSARYLVRRTRSFLQPDDKTSAKKRKKYPVEQIYGGIFVSGRVYKTITRLFFVDCGASSQAYLLALLPQGIEAYIIESSIKTQAFALFLQLIISL